MDPSQFVDWFADPAQWQGSTGILVRLAEHLWYSGASLAIALLIALPVGLLIGHTNRFANIVINVGNLGRAMPDLGIVVLLALLIGFQVTPVIVALLLLAIPPILTNTFTAVRGVDPEVRDAAEGMGLTPWQVLTRVELPVAVPLMFAGIRTAAVQVVATATLAAFIGQLGGLGRYIFDGLQMRDTIRAVNGAILVALLALAVEGLLALLQRTLTPKGLVLLAGTDDEVATDDHET